MQTAKILENIKANELPYRIIERLGIYPEDAIKLVVEVKDYKDSNKPTFKEHLLNIPKVDDLDLERQKDYHRRNIEF